MHISQLTSAIFQMSGQKSEWVKKCIGILKVLKNHKHGWVFSEPVDPVKLNIPDYLEIIKKPMDLGTVRTHLDNGTITNPEEFKTNVRRARPSSECV